MELNVSQLINRYAKRDFIRIIRRYIFNDEFSLRVLFKVELVEESYARWREMKLCLNTYVYTHTHIHIYMTRLYKFKEKLNEY